MALKFFAGLLAIMITSVSPSAWGQIERQHPISVEDSLTLTRLAFPDQRYGASSRFSFSPDQSRFVVATFKADLDSWSNRYELRLYDSRTVLDHVRGHVDEPAPYTVLMSFQAATNDHAIGDLVWSADGQTLIFILKTDEDPGGDVHALDINTTNLTRLTEQPGEIESFFHDDATGMVFGVSEIPQEQSAEAVDMMVAGARPVYELPGLDRLQNRQGYFQSQAGSSQTRLIGELFSPGRGQDEIWVAPDNNAVIGIRARTDHPDHWTRPEIRGAQGLLARFDPYFMGYQDQAFQQYVLIDTETGTIEPVMDAPIANLFRMRPVAEWFPDSRSVMLINTHMPDHENTSGQGYSTEAHVIEYIPETGEVVPIASIPVPVNGRRPAERLTQADVIDQDTVMLTWRSREGSMDHQYERTVTGWALTQETTVPDTPDPVLSLSLEQDANTPPDIWATDAETGLTARITDLNPDFENLAWGQVDQFEWTDAQDRAISGALVYPPDYQDGQRYPLVIQTTASGPGDNFNFDPREFFIDGPIYSSAYAAQSYAARGMMVLQIPNPFPFDGDYLRQSQDHRLIIEAAIDALDASGLIDRQKVGLVGFSNTVVPVWHVLTQSDYDFAAAIVTDGYANGMWGYAWTFGIRSPGMLYLEDTLGGATPWGETQDEWIALNPYFSLDRVDAAVRMELFSPSLPMDWDLYAGMRRLHKPAEYVVLPNGAHNNLKPRERYLSQSGNVDWMAYWLTGYRDPDPAKQDQYDRWDEMANLE